MSTRIVVDAGIPGIQAALEPFGMVDPVSTQDLDRDRLSEAHLLVVRSVVPVGKNLLKGTPIRMVASATAGIDHVDLAYLKAEGIAFAHAPGANADSVVDYVIASLLQIAERRGESLQGRVLGVVGVGEVGSRVVRRAEALGLRVLRCDPPKAASWRTRARRGEPGPFVDLDTVTRESDIISLHTPLTREGADATWHLMGSDRLTRFEGWLINTARGAVVDGAALEALLARGRGPSATVLDVWEGEPTPDPDLARRCDIATTHIAGYATDSKWAATSMMREAVARFLGKETGEGGGANTARLPDVELRPTGQAAGAEGLSWISAIAAQMVCLDRDDAALRASIVDQHPDLSFESHRRNYPGRRLMRRHFIRSEHVPASVTEDAYLSRVLAEALGVRLASP